MIELKKRTIEGAFREEGYDDVVVEFSDGGNEVTVTASCPQLTGAIILLTVLHEFPILNGIRGTFQSALEPAAP